MSSANGREAVIVSGWRTPFGKRGGQFSTWHPVEMLSFTLKGLIDRAGIDVEILSNPPIYSRVDEHAPELCRLVNDALAETCRRDPKRFKAFAHLPFNNMDLALTEMARLLDADLTDSIRLALSRSGVSTRGRAAAARPRSARERPARPARRSHAPAA